MTLMFLKVRLKIEKINVFDNLYIQQEVNMKIFRYKEPPECISNVLPLKPSNINTSNIDLAMLEEAQKIMAKVVRRHGDQYLPAFIRIYNEIESRKKELSYKKIALQIAANDP